MPWDSVEEAEKANKGLAKYSAKAKRGWLSSFNSCYEKGGGDSKCFAIAYSVANKVDGAKAASIAALEDSIGILEDALGFSWNDGDIALDTFPGTTSRCEIDEVPSGLTARRRDAAMDLDEATPQEIGRIADSLAQGLSYHDAAYLSYCINGIVDDEMAKRLRRLYIAAVDKYRTGLLSWFDEALMDRANVVNFGGLNKALTEFVRAIPQAALSGQAPPVPPFRKDWSFLNADRLSAAGRKVASVLLKDGLREGIWKDEGGATGQDLLRDESKGIWYLPYNSWTLHNRNMLHDLGFHPDWQTKSWTTTRLTPEMERMFMQKPTKLVAPTLEQLNNWYYASWLPKNISRFNHMFEAYVRDAGSSITFKFSMYGKGQVAVTMTRGLTRMSQAIEELRLRYLNRMGREPWLEVINEVIKLHTTSGEPGNVMMVIDRMNNLEHSNGMFMERFPADVKSWYLKFLNAKYHAPTAYELAAYLDDSDLRELIQYASGEQRHSAWENPDYQHMEKQGPEQEFGPQVNWLALGYPYQKGTDKPERSDPRVQERLDELRSMGASAEDDESEMDVRESQGCGCSQVGDCGCQQTHSQLPADQAIMGRRMR